VNEQRDREIENTKMFIFFWQRLSPTMPTTTVSFLFLSSIILLLNKREFSVSCITRKRNERVDQVALLAAIGHNQNL